MAIKSRQLLKPLFKALLIFLVSLPVILLLVILETEPSIPASETLQPAEMARLEQFFLEATPQSPGNPGPHQVRVSAGELDLLARYASQTLGLAPDWRSRLSMADQTLNATFSIPLLQSRLSLYLNLNGTLSEANGHLQLSGLQAGNLPIPNALTAWVLAALRNNIAASESSLGDLYALVDTIEDISISPTAMNVQMNWNPALLDQLGQHAQQLFISAEDRRRIIAYYRQISLQAAAMPADLGAVSLNTFLVPLFRTALENSRAGSDPVAENRTLLQTLAIYVSDEDIAQLVGEEAAGTLEPAKFVEVRLHRRQDLARHLISMAAISASAGAGVADMLSITKEAYDARYRSGFSFSDLAANSAGTLLASYATRDAQTAMLMQERLSMLNDETDYMPEIGNNRDGLSEDDFNALYADRNSPEYQARLNEIEQLIAARPLFQNLP
ncbi:MAG: hypothetical protein MRY76_13845 [Pseudomonadales bacterium]|nr:hypothetical protein [Pseudomonadales bacterium]